MYLRIDDCFFIELFRGVSSFPNSVDDLLGVIFVKFFTISTLKSVAGGDLHNTLPGPLDLLGVFFPGEFGDCLLNRFSGVTLFIIEVLHIDEQIDLLVLGIL